ncbi:MAG: hypothetical protein AAF744_01180 [Pseudomonadota bacterium]
MIRFFLTQAVIGFIVATVFVAVLLFLNVANLWHLISGSDVGLIALVVFWALNALVFAGAQMAVAVMLMADEEDDAPRGGTPFAMRVKAVASVNNQEPQRGLRDGTTPAGQF